MDDDRNSFRAWNEFFFSQLQFYRFDGFRWRNIFLPACRNGQFGIGCLFIYDTGVTLTYLNSRGVHQLLSIVTNAPDTVGYPYPSGSIANPAIFQYSSDGVFLQNQLIASANIQAGSKLSLHGHYALNYGNSDASGAASFPSDQHNLALDYGRASFAYSKSRIFGGSIALPRWLSPESIYGFQFWIALQRHVLGRT